MPAVACRTVRVGLRFVLHTLFAVMLMGAVAESVSADPIKFMRDPHISKGMLAFSYQGDIWLANADGTEPRRLTHHVAREIAPRFSPDGMWVAFTSNRFGNNDVFLIPVTGGEPTQLTYHTGSDVVKGWAPDGASVLFSSARSPHPFMNPMYQVPVAGGIPTPMGMDQASDVSVSLDGRLVAYSNQSVPSTRKGYRGNRSADLFVQNVDSGEITQLTDPDIQQFRDHVHDGAPMWGANGRLYFVSERDGIFNVWGMGADGSDPRAVTRHAEGGVKYAAMSPDGTEIVYTQNHELWRVSVPGGTPERVVVELDADPTTNLVEWIETENRAEGFTPSPDGATIAVDFHGEIFLIPTDSEVGEKRQITDSAWRDRYSKFSPDGTHLAYVSDEGASEQLWITNLETGVTRRLSDYASQKTANYVWSPDGSRIAYVASNRLFEADVSDGDTRELGYNIAGGYSLASYNEDGTWLLYDRRDEEQDQDIYLLELSTGTEHDVTQNPFRAFRPS